MSLKLSIIYGSTRKGRLGIRFAKYLEKEFTKRGNNCFLVDPDDLALDTLKKRYVDYDEGKAPSTLAKLHSQFVETDAFIMVSGEYNHFIPPALINILAKITSSLSSIIFQPSIILSALTTFVFSTMVAPNFFASSTGFGEKKS